MIQTRYLASGIAVVKPADQRLTAATAMGFKQAMIAEVEAGHMRLVLDLSEVNFMDSTGLGALVSVLKRIGGRGDLVVAGLQSSTRQMFDLTRMDRVFRVFRSSEEAVGALESS